MSDTILTAKNLEFSFLHKNILDGVAFSINSGEKIALLGRNGMGKSTLLKIIQKELTPDEGTVEYTSGLKVAQLLQKCNFSPNDSCEGVIAANNNYLNSAQINNLVQSQGLKGRLFGELSGGQQRQLLLRAVLLSEPDLIILDEPTNHIDILSIREILTQLKRYHGACLIISHDRWFVEQLAQQIWDLHNGKLRRYDCGFSEYLKRKHTALEHERDLQAQRKLKLKKEEHWLQRGVTARRKRNVGRLERLQQLRQEIKNWQDPERRASLSISEEKASAQKVIAINNLTVEIGGRVLLEDFSYDVIKGEKIGLVGANGIGKTTMLRQILANGPDVKLGERLSLAYFSQQHEDLPDNETALSYMSKDGEYVIQGERRLHVASYLKGFNFIEQQFKTPVNNLSGGERHRLMLAKCLAKPANMLILDEPTNDLDLETLEILEDLLVEFKGTVIIISHDQKFLDNVITSCWILRDKKIYRTNGDLKSWEHMLEDKPEKLKKFKPKAQTKKLSYKDQRILDSLPGKIEQAEQELSKLQNEMNAADFYKRHESEIRLHSEQMSALESELSVLYQQWEELEGKSI